VNVKIKSLLDGKLLTKTFKGNEQLDSVDLSYTNVQYLYKDADKAYFMDNDTYEQIELAMDVLGDQVGYLKEGDVVKAMAAGAGSVMLGSMFAGVDESPGETIIYEGRKFKSYRGMGSIEAMQQGSSDRYFQSEQDDMLKLVPEGISGRVPYKGTLAEVIYQIIGGLRAGMGYCGAADMAALSKAHFVRITNAGIRESHPHDVTITREAPNYSLR
jgi:hypothetical protein